MGPCLPYFFMTLGLVSHLALLNCLVTVTTVHL
jgi:hypothetical protein